MRGFTLAFALLISVWLSISAARSQVNERLLQVGDRVRITVQNEADVTKEAVIDKDGSIQLALLGIVKISDLTTPQASEMIKKLLKDYIVEPDVTVELIESGKIRVFVVGEVQKPGVYMLERGSKLLEAITLAGYTENSDPAKATIHRGAETLPVDLSQFLAGNDLTANLPLTPDDTIVVARRDLGNSVLVLGEVSKSGSTPFISGMTIKELIEACGGVKPDADISRITIRRSGSQESVPIDLASLKGTVGQTAICSGDTVMVPRSQTSYFIAEGGVNQPGRYCLTTGMTIEDALAAAGGLSKDAKIDSIQLVHTNCGARSSQVVNLKCVRTGSSPIICIQPQDVIVVPIKKSKPSALEIIAAIGTLGWIFVH